MIAVGQVYRSAWGRYAVHRVDHPDGEGVVLRDLDRPGATVLPRLARLGSDYQLEQDAAPASAATLREELPIAAPAPALAPALAAAQDVRRKCWDCRRPSTWLWATDDPDGPEYCSGCLMGARPKHVPSTGTWRPPPGVEDANPHKAELGSFARIEPGALPPATAKPERQPVTRDLWAQITAGVDRG